MNLPHQKIDPTSLYRWNDLKPYLPIGESSWRRMVNAKSAPQPIKLSRKCTLWRGADVLEWLEHPDTYQPPIRGMDGGIRGENIQTSQ